MPLDSSGDVSVLYSDTSLNILHSSMSVTFPFIASLLLSILHVLLGLLTGNFSRGGDRH